MQVNEMNDKHVCQIVLISQIFTLPQSHATPAHISRNCVAAYFLYASSKSRLAFSTLQTAFLLRKETNKYNKHSNYSPAALDKTKYKILSHTPN